MSSWRDFMQIVLAFLSLVGAVVPQVATKHEVVEVYVADERDFDTFFLEDGSFWSCSPGWVEVGDGVEISKPYQHFDWSSPEGMDEELILAKRLRGKVLDKLEFIGWDRGDRVGVSESRVIKHIQLKEEVEDHYIEALHPQDVLDEMTELVSEEIIFSENGGVFLVLLGQTGDLVEKVKRIDGPKGWVR
ncbi:MAG: hypothetical protein S4CHLAM102_11970 [Chlamydiia bacterium]|nr:hypothetical protein [Chlamydiia bacterium]